MISCLSLWRKIYVVIGKIGLGMVSKPVILAAWKAEMERITVPGQP
jgi:hypothetical protein